MTSEKVSMEFKTRFTLRWICLTLTRLQNGMCYAHLQHLWPVAFPIITDAQWNETSSTVY